MPAGQWHGERVLFSTAGASHGEFLQVERAGLLPVDGAMPCPEENQGNRMNGKIKV